MEIRSEIYGELADGTVVRRYLLDNGLGLRAGILSYGGIIHSLEAADAKGDMADVALGHADIGKYVPNKGKLGAAIGRNANRLSGSRVRISGREYVLEANENGNNLHGGSAGFHNRIFNVYTFAESGQPSVRLEHTLADLSDGFPGNLRMTITYTVTCDNALRIEYAARCDRDTILNPTNHGYFNLGGHGSGSILDHVLEIDAACYTPTDTDKLPTGEIRLVAGTPYDFRSPKKIGADIGADFPYLPLFGGYDVNYVLNGRGFRRVAVLTDEKSGRRMEALTDMPGLQLFSGNSLTPDDVRKDGAVYNRYQGVCLETQFFPNSGNIPWFPYPFLAAEHVFSSTTAYRFSTL